MLLRRTRRRRFVLPPIQNRYPARRDKNAERFAKYGFMVIDFVPDVPVEGNIDDGIRQRDRRRLALVQRKIFLCAGSVKFGVQLFDHLGLQIDSTDVSGSTHRRSHGNGKIPRTRSNVGYTHAFMESQMGQNLGWRHPLQPFGILQFVRVSVLENAIVHFKFGVPGLVLDPGCTGD